MNENSSAYKNKVHLYQGDPLLRLILDHWRLRPWQVSILTALVGFGALSAWYIIFTHLRPELKQLRGLFDFYSATWGDALILPLLNGLAVWYYLYTARVLTEQIQKTFAAQPKKGSLFLHRVNRAYNHPLVVVSLILTTLTLSFLWHWGEVHGVDRNWTLPVLGQRNGAGIYHHLFLSLELYIFFFLSYRHLVTTWALLRLARLTTSKAALADAGRRIFVRLAWILFFWGIFDSLFLIDFFYGIENTSLSTLFGGLPLAVLSGYYVIVTLWGVLPIFALALALRQPLTFPVPIVLSYGVIFVLPLLYII